MYILITKQTQIDPEERELFQDDGEGIAVFIEYMAENQEVPTTHYAIDDFTEEDIELQLNDYFDSDEIDTLNAMFIASNDWTEEQITFILELKST